MDKTFRAIEDEHCIIHTRIANTNLGSNAPVMVANMWRGRSVNLTANMYEISLNYLLVMSNTQYARRK